MAPTIDENAPCSFENAPDEVAVPVVTDLERFEISPRNRTTTDGPLATSCPLSSRLSACYFLGFMCHTPNERGEHLGAQLVEVGG
jgi:hypothetical protein